MVPHFYDVSAHIGLFELSRTRVSGHHGRTGATLDVGATLVGSSDKKFSPDDWDVCASSERARMSPSERRLLCIFTNHLPFFEGKNGVSIRYLNSVSQFPYLVTASNRLTKNSEIQKKIRNPKDPFF
jgi:hypothetical protein